MYGAFRYRLFCWKLKIKNNKKIISSYYSHQKILYICLDALFISHKQCTRCWSKGKKRVEKKNVQTWTRSKCSPSVRLDWNEKLKLFHYLAYFYYYYGSHCTFWPYSIICQQNKLNLISRIFFLNNNKY